MKKGQCIRLKVGLRFMAAAALMLALPLTQARAQINCATVTASSSTDSDRDGFTDFQECNGIATLGTAPRSFPPCTATSDRTQCLDPNTKDLFVILAPATPTSLIPSDPLRFASALQSAGGLGIAVHLLTPDQAGSDRSVTSASPQKAVRITESLDPTGNILGYCNYGTPDNLDRCTVFTQRIKNFVESVYASVGQTPPAGLIDDYIRHTFAHESGHTLSLTATYDSRFGGYHYQSGTDVVMEQAVTYTVKGGIVTFNLSTAFATPDPSQVKLLP